jgi:hypothetical protein
MAATRTLRIRRPVARALSCAFPVPLLRHKLLWQRLQPMPDLYARDPAR